MAGTIDKPNHTHPFAYFTAKSLYYSITTVPSSWWTHISKNLFTQEISSYCTAFCVLVVKYVL